MDPVHIAAAAVVVPAVVAIVVERIKARATSKRDVIEAVEAAVNAKLAALAARVPHVERKTRFRASGPLA